MRIEVRSGASWFRCFANVQQSGGREKPAQQFISGQRHCCQYPWAIWLLFAYLLCGPIVTSSFAGDTDGVAFFESKVRPLLVERCIECHGPEKQKGGLRLDLRAGWQTGGEHGSPVLPGKPEESLLIKTVRSADRVLQMHPKEKGVKLGEAEIAVLIQWVKMGAPDPRDAEARTAAAPVAEKAKTWWAFQSVKRSRVPVAGVPDPIDAFVEEKIVAAGLEKALPADRRSLLRRATFDLTGLPPTPDEVRDFLQDHSPGAFARVVDRLLASPTYGQRVARHWLDVVRYADYHDADPKARTASCEPLEAWR